MDDVFVYIVELPRKVREIVTPCADGYTVYISSSLGLPKQREALLHAIHHILNNDFSRDNVNEIELEADRVCGRKK